VSIMYRMLLSTQLLGDIVSVYICHVRLLSENIILQINGTGEFDVKQDT